MSVWTNFANGHWTNAAKWTGGVPNGLGAVAEFTVAGAGAGLALIDFDQDDDIFVGTLNIVTTANEGYLFRGAIGSTNSILHLQGAGGSPAFLTVDTNGSSVDTVLSGDNGLRLFIASDLILTTQDSDTHFEISAPISGGGDLYKFGSGTLELSGDNHNWIGDLNLLGGRTEMHLGADPDTANIRLDNGAVLAGNSVFANRIEVGPHASGTITTDGQMHLSGTLVVGSDAIVAVKFGTPDDNGIVFLRGTTQVTGAGGFMISNGPGQVRFGTDDAAANYFSGLSATGLLQVAGQLNTDGRAAVVANLDLDGGLIASANGALNLTVNDITSGLNVQTGTIEGTAGADRVVVNATTHFDFSGTSFTSWTAGTDTITINGGLIGNTLIGSAEKETINGNGGNDTLNGNGGADVLIGGTGNDTYVIGDALDTLVENVGEGGADEVQILAGGPTTFTLAANFERLTFLNNLTHVGNGNTAANIITGGDGADTLDGKGGADSLAGGAGGDLYFVDTALDQVTEGAAQGNDRVFASVSYVLAAGQEVETLSTDFNAGTAAINLTGNEFANTIFGNAGVNMLNGGAGIDTMAGFGGDDFYFVDNAADRAVESAGQGTDRVLASVSYALAAGTSVEALTTTDNAGTTAINLTGNELAQSMLGNAGANMLNGGGAADTMVGFGGDDLYTVDNAGDRAVEAAAGGTDRVFAGVSWALETGSSVETISTTNNAGTTAINLTGNELANTIFGNAGANILNGKAGADTLFGMAGADTFAFTTALGAGNVDRLLDMQSGTDKIALDDAIFTGIGLLGALNAGAFVTGAAAADAGDRIVYNNATGQLFFDADGIGGVAAVLFATLDGNPAIGAGDFTVI